MPCGNGCAGNAVPAPSGNPPNMPNADGQMPIPGAPYAIPPGVELACDNQELLNELRSLQISDKAFQDVVKLPSLEVQFLLQKLQQNGEENRNISGYLETSVANFWAQGPHVPLIPASSEGTRADEKGTVEGAEEPCSLVGVAPVPKVEPLQIEHVEEAAPPPSSGFMSWTEAALLRH